MRREDIYDCLEGFVRKNDGFKWIKNVKLYESEDVIFWAVTEFNEERYKHPRRIFVVSMRIGKRHDRWLTFTPSLDHVDAFRDELNKFFNEVWNGNIENWSNIRE